MIASDKLVNAYITLRDKRKELKDEYESKDSVLKSQMERIEVELLKNLDEAGATSLNTGEGTAYISSETRASCGDWAALYSVIQQTGRFDFLERRVSSKAIAQYLEETGDLPPGVTISSERVVRVRRS